MKDYKILYYDLETSPMKAYIWQLGKQVVRHNQLDKEWNKWGIICATYCWNDGKPAQAIDWGYNAQDSKRVVKKLDALIQKADIVIGKNNNRFDNKMLNSLRMFNNLPGVPNWMKRSEDLETQMRRYFRLPSYALDYISGQLGLGGKIKMEFQDWIDICEKDKECGRAKFEKMIEYGKKDVEDTRYLWDKLSEHFDTTMNVARLNDIRIGCKHCGSENVKRNGVRVKNASKFQMWYCNSCGRYAGESALSPVKNNLGQVK